MEDEKTNSENQKTGLDKIFRVLPYVLAALGLGMFFYTVLTERDVPEQAIYWFLMVIGAFILPYIKEITFRDLRVKLDSGLKAQKEQMEKTQQDLEKLIENEFAQANERVKTVDSAFGEIRDELITGYQVYLQKCLQPEERRTKVAMLNRMYLKEMGIEVTLLKEMLAKTPYFSGEINDAFTSELVKALEDFQESAGMVPDGVFGHNTFKNLQKAIGEAV